MIRKLLLLAGAGSAAAVLTVAGFVGLGWRAYHLREREIVERMDQYFLSLTSPGREEYLLDGDETFEVPYMASTLSVAAEPTRFYDLNDKLIGEFSVEKAVAVRDPADLPEYLKRALVATEDGTFYRHKGVNWRAIARAALTNLKRLRSAQGGSTLTQQLAKMMFTTRKKTYGRKIFELFCAQKLEEKFTKDQILLMYFNFAYFGHGAFGVEQAARYYFGKTTKELELAEAAMLVGLVASPNKYSPYESLELAQARHRTVLSRMARLGYIPSNAVQRYSTEFWNAMAAKPRNATVSFWRMKVNEAPYPVEHLRRILLKEFTQEKLVKGGLKVRTTIDLVHQRAAQTALTRALREQNAETPDEPPIEGSFASVRPSDGAILAMVGGSGFDFDNQLDRATSARRLIGSAVKPFVFAVAFEGGRRLEDEIVDEPISFKLPGGRKWSPANYGDKYHGKVTLKFALADSLNSVAIRLLQSVELSRVIGALSAASGVPEREFPRNLSLALGTMDMSALELARAYSVFVNDGKSAVPYIIRTVEDRDGKILRDDRARPEPAVVFSTEVCRTTIEAMRAVLAPGGTGYGAARRAGFNIPAAGKTGTTNDYRDAWFAGVTPDLSAAVWMGRDDMRIPLGQGRAGGAISAPVWMQYVKAVYRDRPTREFAAKL